MTLRIMEGWERGWRDETRRRALNEVKQTLVDAGIDPVAFAEQLHKALRSRSDSVMRLMSALLAD
jgi:hypothetical protein